MKQIVIFFLFCCSINTIDASTIFTVCADYDNTGNPINSYNIWSVKRAGNFMYIFLKSDQLLTKKYHVRIEKQYNRNDTSFLLFDRFDLKNDGTKNWIANKYTFLKSGIYKFLLFEDEIETPINTYYTTILYTEDTYVEDGFVDTWYYRNTDFRFCDSIQNEKLFGVKDVFKAQPNETKITIYISQYDKLWLKTDRMLAKIYKIEKNEKKFLFTDVFFTQYNWKWTFLDLYLQKKGKYLIELYNEEDVFINSRNLELE